jgi:hypothetical protein
MRWFGNEAEIVEIINSHNGLVGIFAGKRPRRRPWRSYIILLKYSL